MKVRAHQNTHKHKSYNVSSTFVVGGEAEHIVVVLLLVSQAIVSDARHRVLASTGFSGEGDGILDRAVTQPAGVAPVHLPLPGLIQLIEGRHDGVLASTRSLGVVEVEIVASQAGEVGEHNTYRERKAADMTDDHQLGARTTIHHL